MFDVSGIPADAPAWVSTRMLAGWLGTNGLRLRRWAKRGRFPRPLKVGRSIVIWDVAAVRAALAPRQPAA
jgi:hypothetical protein